MDEQGPENSKNNVSQTLSKYMAAFSPEERAALEASLKEKMDYYQVQLNRREIIIPKPEPATIENYKKIVGLTHLDPDPTSEDLARLDRHNQTIYRTSLTWPTLYSRAFPPPSFREKEREIIIPRIRDFKAYDSLEEILHEWSWVSLKAIQVKFVKPLSHSEWKGTIWQCATMVKVLKTLQYFMPTSLYKYSFIYQSKTLFKKTTHVFDYNSVNNSFIFKTGLGSGGQEVKNMAVDFYEQVQQQLHYLLDAMKIELPQAQYEQVYKEYLRIKDMKQSGRRYRL